METDRGRCSSDRNSTHGTIHYFVMLNPITSHAKKDIVRQEINQRLNLFSQLSLPAITRSSDRSFQLIYPFFRERLELLYLHLDTAQSFFLGGTSVGGKCLFLGILYAVLKYHNKKPGASIEYISTEDRYLTPSDLISNLGVVIKSSKLKDFEPVIYMRSNDSDKKYIDAGNWDNLSRNNLQLYNKHNKKSYCSVNGNSLELLIEEITLAQL